MPPHKGGLGRLFTKNTGLRKIVRPCMRANATSVSKVKVVGDLMSGELATEAPVNSDRNYNGPKVAKFYGGVSSDSHEMCNDLDIVSKKNLMK